MPTKTSTGTFTYKFSSGQKESEVNYKDGELHGKYTTWYTDGQKSWQGNYKDGHQDGKYTAWYENGQKSWEGNYKDKKDNGKFTSWHENGQKSWEGNYKDGHLDGKYTSWYEDGQMEVEAYYKDGKQTEWTEYSSNKPAESPKDRTPEESSKEPTPEEGSKEPTIKQVSEVLLVDPYDLLVLLRKIGISKTQESDTINLSERKEVLQHLSDNGNPVAQCFLGSFCYADENYKEAFNLWSLAALQEDMLSEAMQDTINNNIGLAYYFGKGVKQDYKKASEWYLKSANSNGKRSQVSQYNLATMYLNGDGVDIDISKAKYYANKAREGSIQKITNLAKQMCEKYNF